MLLVPSTHGLIGGLIAPVFTVAPSVAGASGGFSGGTYSAGTSDTLTANCVVTGTPTPTLTYRWWNVNSTETLGTAQTISCAPLGGVQCMCTITATNSAGSVSANTPIVTVSGGD